MRPIGLNLGKNCRGDRFRDPRCDDSRGGDGRGAARRRELGYRGASVRAVLEYSKQFYDHFESLADCFAQAYGAWIDRLAGLLDSVRAEIELGQ
jgi:hypothetical protein